MRLPSLSAIAREINREAPTSGAAKLPFSLEKPAERTQLKQMVLNSLSSPIVLYCRN
jgi:hypothetical protein